MLGSLSLLYPTSAIVPTPFILRVPRIVVLCDAEPRPLNRVCPLAPHRFDTTDMILFMTRRRCADDVSVFYQ